MSSHKLTRKELQQLAALGLREKIVQLSQEILRLQAIQRTMMPRRPGRPPMVDLATATQVLARATNDRPPRKPRTDTKRALLSRAMKRRWKAAKKAGKKLQDGGF